MMEKYDIDYLIGCGQKFYKDLINDSNGRYKSWEHCFLSFHKAHKNLNPDYDNLCLHLAFYLASWGMYRGSSFLLRKDYKVHMEVIKEILKKEYNNLWSIKIIDYEKLENQKKLVKLTEEIKKIYKGIYEDIIKNSMSKKIKNINISNTLITKVLLGTMGCIPAYDRYFIYGIKKYDITPNNYNLSKSIKKLLEFYTKNSRFQKFINSDMKIENENIEYPQMKKMDMCFWEAGKELQEKDLQEEAIKLYKNNINKDMICKRLNISKAKLNRYLSKY